MFVFIAVRALNLASNKILPVSCYGFFTVVTTTNLIKDIYYFVISIHKFLRVRKLIKC